MKNYALKKVNFKILIKNNKIKINLNSAYLINLWKKIVNWLNKINWKKNFDNFLMKNQNLLFFQSLPCKISQLIDKL